jgi:signal transduction histidine kinase
MAKKPPRPSLRLYLWVALTLLAVLGPPPAAYARDDHKRVLVVYSTRRVSEFSMTGESTLPRILDAGLSMNVDYYSEFIDSTRFPDAAYQVAFADFLRLKYQGLVFDAIVALQDPALQFVQGHREALFGSTPLIYLANTAGVEHPRYSTGLIHERNFAATLELIRQLQPDLQRLYVVTGAARADKGLEEVARSQLRRTSPPVEFIFLSGLPTKTLVEQLSRLPAHSAVYYVLVGKDGDGNRFRPNEYIDYVVKAANAPTYSWVDSTMGRGILGGSLYSQRLALERVGDLTLRVLRGEKAENIPIATLQLNAPQIDWRQLRRWHIDESRVPEGAEIRFRNSTWDRYKHYIAAAFAVLVIQTGLIGGLLIQRKRRWRAEEKLRQSQGELRRSSARNRDLGARLLRAQEGERARIARELHDDICQRMLLLTLDLEALNRLAAGEQPAVDALTNARDISKSLHDLSHRLHPARLRIIGLAAALGHLCNDTSRAGIPINYTQEHVPARLPADLMLCLFRIVQEALQNAIKYSGAKTVSVRLTGGEEGLTLNIADDGVGFDIEEAWGKGVGLASMVERIEAMGGTLEVHSQPSEGSCLTATVPRHVFEHAASAAPGADANSAATYGNIRSPS